MTLILDTAPLVTFSDVRDPRNQEVRTVLHAERGPLILPAPITAETDYFLATRIGPDSARRFLADIARGVFQVECLDAAEYQLVHEVSLRYADLAPGLADLSIVALAARFRTLRILTFDHRHFRTIRPMQGGSFVLLPADEPAASG